MKFLKTLSDFFDFTLIFKKNVAYFIYKRLFTFEQRRISEIAQAKKAYHLQ